MWPSTPLVGVLFSAENSTTDVNSTPTTAPTTPWPDEQRDRVKAQQYQHPDNHNWSKYCRLDNLPVLDS